MERRSDRSWWRLATLALPLAVVSVVGGAFAVGSAGDAAPRQEGETCPGVQAAVGFARTNGTSAPELSALTTEGVPYDVAGATVTVDPERQLVVGYDGRTRTLTTEPHQGNGHYPSRTGPVPGQTSLGIVFVHVQDDGTFLTLNQGNSGYAGRWAWRIDGPCGSGSPASAPPADAVEGSASYTG